MSCLWQDFRFGIRTLLRNRRFTVTAIAALALGIGANSAIFSVIYGVLLKPLPYREPERLVRVYENNPVERFQKFPLSRPIFSTTAGRIASSRVSPHTSARTSSMAESGPSVLPARASRTDSSTCSARTR